MKRANDQGASRPARIAWTIVVGTALSLSWWGLYSLSRRYGMPAPLAAVVSAAIDGAGLYLGDLARRYARTPDSGAGPRALMLAVVALSGYLNWQHAALLAYPTAARVLFAAPAAIAGILFELEQRWAHRDELRRLGRVSPALPPFGRWAWIMHPLAVFKRMWKITKHRVESVPVDVLDWRPSDHAGYSAVLEAERVLDTTPLPARVPVEGPRTVAPAATVEAPEYVEQPEPEYVPDVATVNLTDTNPPDAVPDPLGGVRLPAPAETWRRAVEVHRESIENTGRPPSIRELKAALSVGQKRAVELRDALHAQMNGTPR